ncbi:hypothetical protein FSF62_025445, partial [Escherichia coli]|nr:hypothetical protein [Escherichia coli]MBC0363528.1 hypothetical protein [Escherichia coli]MBC0418988.1 hypothetical protein [Escherichia coli]
RISSLEVRDDIERRAYEIALVSLEVEPDEREAYELFMEKRFGDLVDRRRAKCHERCNSDPHPTPEIRSR